MLRDAHMAQELTAALARAVSDERWQHAFQELDALQEILDRLGRDIVQKSREENRMLDPGDKEK
jgi:hypothetical protein